MGLLEGEQVWFLSITHCIVPCLISSLEDILVTGNVANEDMGFIRGIIHNQSSIFTRSAGELLALVFQYSKGSAAPLLLLASQSVETYCLYAYWIFALWGVNPPSCSKALLHSFLRFWLASQGSKPLCSNVWLLQAKQVIYICAWFPLCGGILSKPR